MFRTLFLSLFSMLILCSCLAPSMPYNKMQMRNLTPFTSIVIDGPMDVDVEETGQDFAGVFVEKEPSLNDIVTNVEDGVLKVTCNRGFVNELVPKIVILTSQKISSVKIKSAGNFSFESIRSDGLVFECSGPTDVLISGSKDLLLKELRLSDMSNLTVTGARAGALEVYLDGNAHLELRGTDAALSLKKLSSAGNSISDLRNISSESLSIEMPEASVVKIQGSAAALYVKASAGELKASKLDCKYVEIIGEGPADLDVRTGKKLKVSLAKGACVECSGDPVEIEKNIDSSSCLSL